MSALHLAASKGYLETVEVLLQAGVDVNSICDFDFVFWGYKLKNASSLHLASFHGHLEIVKLLVQVGADASAKCKCRVVRSF